MIKGSILCSVSQSQVQVMLFIISELLDEEYEVGVQARIVVDHLRDLLIVMFRHQILHGNRAGHGAGLSQQSTAGAQREAGQLPEGDEDGWVHLVLHQQLLELGKVSLLVLPHLLDQRGSSLVVLQHKHLTLVDIAGSHLSRVIHPYYLLYHSPSYQIFILGACLGGETSLA